MTTTAKPEHAQRSGGAPRITPITRLIASSAMSNLADGVFVIALPLVALGITRDPGAFAAVTLVGRLPWLLFALPAGALADRLDRRRTMTLVNIARAGLIASLAGIVATDNETLWALYVIAFALGTGETLFDTAAQSIVPAVAGPDHLSLVNSRLYAVELTANQFVGPPLGGVLVAVSAALALGGSAAAYALAAVVLMSLRGSFRPDRGEAPPTIRRDIADGIRYLGRHRVLRTLALCVGLSNLAFTAQFAVLPLFVVDPGPMGLSATGFGILLSTSAIGALIGSAITPWIERTFGRSRALTASMCIFPIVGLTPALTVAVGAFAAAMLIAGIVNVVWNVITVSLRQRIVPDAMLGRVNAGYRLVAWGTMPLGALLGGVLASAFGLRSVFWVSAGLGLLCVPILRGRVTDDAIAAAEAANEAVVPQRT